MGKWLFELQFIFQYDKPNSEKYNQFFDTNFQTICKNEDNNKHNNCKYIIAL